MLRVITLAASRNPASLNPVALPELGCSLKA